LSSADTEKYWLLQRKIPAILSFIILKKTATLFIGEIHDHQRDDPLAVGSIPTQPTNLKRVSG